MGLGTGRCQGVSGPLLQGCCVCWQELKIKNLLVKGGSVSIEEQTFWNWNTSHRAIEDESQLPAGQAQHQALLPRGNIIVFLSHLASEEPEGLNSKSFGQTGSKTTTWNEIKKRMNYQLQEGEGKHITANGK